MRFAMQRYFAKECNNGEIILIDSDIHHIKNVMRMNKGEKIEVICDNKLYICNIENLNPLSLSVDSISLEERGILYDVTIALGLVKEQKMDLILQKLTELGVSRIIPVEMERSIVKIDKERLKKKMVRWQTICKEASEQSKRMDIPTVTNIMTIEDLIRIESDIKLVASTKEKNKMLDYYLQRANECVKIIMVIGPEGGISEREESFLLANGFDSVSFGPLIFRVETAAIYAGAVFNFYSSKR